MRFVCESCRAQYMINDDKVGPKGVKVRCRKCDYVITVKRPAAAPPKVAALEPDEMPTQVMMPPPAGARPVDGVKSGESDEAARSTDNFLGADEDEIGAVFDQVLRSGPTSAPKAGADGLPGSALSTDFDEHESTRVIDAATVAQLARESSASEPAAEKAEAPPETNWFVAINEKQTGPLTLDEVKEHWDKGEVGPDSLCWREGFQDWLPLSEVKSLAVVLAPKPPRPIVVPAATIPAAAASASAPVQSAFSAGGVVPAAPGEAQAPMPPVAVSMPEDSGAWKPTAASALASLVKDEMDALARPSAPSPAPAPQPAVAGLLDVPDEKGALSGPLGVPAAAGAGAGLAARPPVNPYASNPAATYSTPGMTSYRPPSNRGMVIGVGVGVGVVLVGLIASVVWLAAGRTGPTTAPAPVPAPAPASTSAAVQPQGPVGQAPVGQAPVGAPAPSPTTPPSPAPGTTATALTSTGQGASPVAAGTPRPTPTPEPGAQATAAREALAAAKPPAPRKEGRAKADTPAETREPRETKEPSAEEPKGRSSGGDEFEDAFGKPTAKREEPKKPAGTKRESYVPPAPGAGSDLKETLEQSDIMEVVLSNKPALLKCAEEQHQKEPGTNGKLVIRWSIQGNGRVSNVVVVSEEFKNTYMAGCVGKAIKGWVFPRSKSPPEPFTLPVKF